MLKALQDLFATLQANDIRATATVALAEAFGWENNEALQQHDVAELTRVLVEALEQSLLGTEYDSAMEEFFFGVQNTVVTCSACNESRIR